MIKRRFKILRRKSLPREGKPNDAPPYYTYKYIDA